MKLSVRICQLCLVALVLTAAAHAQSGCVVSPENPTAVLGLVGLAGAAWPALRARLRRK
jgi:XrtJ-associated TM-motif-TM protein